MSQFTRKQSSVWSGLLGLDFVLDVKLKFKDFSIFSISSEVGRLTDSDSGCLRPDERDKTELKYEG